MRVGGCGGRVAAAAARRQELVDELEERGRESGPLARRAHGEQTSERLERHVPELDAHARIVVEGAHQALDRRVGELEQRLAARRRHADAEPEGEQRLQIERVQVGEHRLHALLHQRDREYRCRTLLKMYDN